jgi:ATP-dependent Clp protease ATP-binding subunit ClpC
MGVDLTDDALMGKLNPIIGRHQELERVTRILCRRNKNNPVLIGGPGVGKTAIVKGLAQRLVGNEVSTIIAGKRLLTLDLGVLPGIITKWRDEAGQQLQKIPWVLRGLVPV